MDVWDVSNDGSLSADGKRRGYFGAGAGTLGGWGGATAGAALGTMLFPGVGSLVGGALGGFGGYVGGKGALNWLWGQDPSGGTAALSPKIDLGQGKIEINVRVQDDRVQASTTFADMANISLMGGNTNPAGY